MYPHADGLTYLVQTSLGNTLLPGQSHAMVNIQGNTFLEVAVEDLKEGQMVVYKKEHIDKTLEEVEPVLERSKRYVSARDTLHVSDAEGNRITRFRNDLFKTVGSKAGIENLEARLFAKEVDFSEGEYSRAIDAVRDILKDGGVDRNYDRTTIKNWLDGTTLAPLDWGVFTALSAESKQFESYNDPSTGIKDDYALYVTVRKGVMRYLATKGKEAPKRHTDTSKERNRRGGSLKLEIDLVVDEFMEDIGEHYALAQVVSVTPVRPRRHEAKPKPEVRLSDGVISQVPDDLSSRVITYQEIASHVNAIEAINNILMMRYFERGAERELISNLGKGGFGVHFGCSSLADMVLSGYFKTQWPEEAYALKRTKEVLGKKGFEGFDKRMYQALLDGEIDRVLGLEPGSAHLAYRTLSRLREALPAELNEVENISAEMRMGKARSPFQSTIRRNALETTLREKYGVNTRLVKRMLYSDLSGAPGFRIDLTSTEDMDSYARIRAEKETLPNILTKSEFTGIVGRYGLTQLLPLIPEAVWAADGWRK